MGTSSGRIDWPQDKPRHDSEGLGDGPGEFLVRADTGEEQVVAEGDGEQVTTAEPIAHGEQRCGIAGARLAWHLTILRKDDELDL